MRMEILRRFKKKMAVIEECWRDGMPGCEISVCCDRTGIVG
jgi:hypothetical protein